MTNGWVLPEGVLRDAPAYTPRPHELADLELDVVVRPDGPAVADRGDRTRPGRGDVGAEAEGRDDASIEKTISTRLSPGESADAFATRCATFGGWGIEHVVCITPGAWDDERLAVLSAAAKALARLPD